MIINLTEEQKSMMVRISGVVTESVVDGPGIRATIFFQGCCHACPGCQNPETRDIYGGKAISLVDLLSLLKLNPLINGITFSGGEPFLQAYPAAVLGRILTDMGFSLWVYTGFTWEDLITNFERPGFKELLKIADVVIDGPFIQDLKDNDSVFRGSRNQRIIEVKNSLMTGRVIEWFPAATDILL
jgi:anaerobic ribonucleoside-triphosphate reductase activating protein